MSLLTAILIVVLVTAVLAVVSGPVRAARRERETASPSRPQHGGDAGEPGDPRQARGEGDLEAAREAKYREIRDAELDYRTGKLSREDYEAIDRQLRAEAVEILHRLDSADT